MISFNLYLNLRTVVGAQRSQMVLATHFAFVVCNLKWSLRWYTLLPLSVTLIGFGCTLTSRLIPKMAFNSLGRTPCCFLHLLLMMAFVFLSLKILKMISPNPSVTQTVFIDATKDCPVYQTNWCHLHYLRDMERQH